MVRTLIKHEFLRTRGVLGAILGISVLMGLVGGGIALLQLPGISAFGQLLAVLGVLVPVPGIQLALAIDYWRNAYRPGYLTHTLPVKGSTQYWARLAWGFSISLVALGITLALAKLLLPAQFDLDLFAQLPVWLQVSLPLLALSTLILPLIQFYFAASVGSERQLSKLGVGGPIVVWIVSYLGIQLLSFIGILAIPLGLLDVDGGAVLVQSSVLDAMLHSQKVRAMPLGWLAAFVVTMVALPWRTAVSWKSKVTLN